jgi:hypothetical protein
MMMNMNGTMNDLGMQMSLQKMDMNTVMYPEIWRSTYDDGKSGGMKRDMKSDGKAMDMKSGGMKMGQMDHSGSYFY